MSDTIPVKPFGVDDVCYDIIMHPARPLARGLRDQFLEDVASSLRNITDPGPGEVFRICREMQRKHFDPPLAAR
jgi:hypothetical protein